MFERITGRKTLRAGKAKAVIDFRTMHIPFVGFDGEPKDYPLLVRKVVAYLKKRGIQRVAAAVDLTESSREMREWLRSHQASPMLLIVSVSVNRMAHG